MRCPRKTADGIGVEPIVDQVLETHQAYSKEPAL